MGIDWSAPIEAVHEDGRTLPVTSPGLTPTGHRRIEPHVCGSVAFREDGLHFTGWGPWDIRNVASPSNSRAEPNSGGTMYAGVAPAVSSLGDSLAGDCEHWSDCAVNNEPAYPAGPCDCGGYRAGDERKPPSLANAVCFAGVVVLLLPVWAMIGNLVQRALR